MNNYGDDLFSLLSYKAINEKLVSAQCELVGPTIVNNGSGDELKLNRLSKQYSNFNLTGKITRLTHYMHATVHADYFMFCGGSLYSSPNRSVKDIMYLMNCNRYKFHALGVSVGPFDTLAAEKRAIEILRNYEYIALRDQKSFDRVESFNIDAKVVLAGDLAGLGLEYFDTNEKIVKSGRSKNIGFSPCNLNDLEKSKSYIDNFVSNMKYLSTHLDFEVSIICLNQNSSNGDVGLCKLTEKLLKEIGVNCKIIYYLEIGVENTWKLISSLDFFVSVRLHGAITAYLVETPFFLYEYHEKCSEFLNYIGDITHDYILDKVFLAQKITDGFNENKKVMNTIEFYKNSLMNISENPLVCREV